MDVDTTKVLRYMSEFLAERELAAAWSHALGTPVLDVRYEDLSARPLDELRRVLRFLAVDDDAAVTASLRARHKKMSWHPGSRCVPASVP